MIAETRAELKALLAAIPVVHEYVPEELNSLPAAVLQPADPFIFEPDPGVERGRTFGEDYVCAWDVILCVDLGNEQSNQQASAELDTLLESVLEAVKTSDVWWLDSMAQPGAMETTTWITHGQRVTVARYVAL